MATTNKAEVARIERARLADEIMVLREKSGREDKSKTIDKFAQSRMGKQILAELLEKERRGIDAFPPLPKKDRRR